MFTLAHLGSARIIAALLVAVTALCAADQATADTESFERAWKEGDYETILKQLQPLVDAGDEEAIKAAEFAKFMLRVEKKALAYRNAEGPVDLRDFDGRYEPMVPGPQQRRFALGQEAFERKDYETAFREWLPLADGGYAEAQFQIARLYDSGLGAPKDAKRAEQYYTLSAAQGYSPAEVALIYFNNPILQADNEQDQQLSLFWALRAASNGNRIAYETLAIAYCHGVGVRKNPVLADIWLYMQTASEDDLHEHGCSKEIEFPASYREAIRERAEAMSKALDIPIAPDYEPKGN